MFHVKHLVFYWSIKAFQRITASSSLLAHNKITASQFIRRRFSSSWYKQVHALCLLLFAIKSGDLLDSVPNLISMYHEAYWRCYCSLIIFRIFFKQRPQKARSHTAPNYAININSLHCEARYWKQNEQQLSERYCSTINSVSFFCEQRPQKARSHTAPIYAININSLHCEARYWKQNEQQLSDHRQEQNGQ